MDRGGLRWPSDFSVSLASEICKLFQSVIKNRVSESKLVNASNPRSLLICLAEKKLKSLNLTAEICPDIDCKTSIDIHVKKFITTIVNILLSNYCKKLSDKVFVSKQSRKIKTYSKRL